MTGEVAVDEQLDSLMIVGDETGLDLVCERCDAILCDVEDGDTLAVILRLGAEHVRECVGFG